jgi:hypothetical protein
MSTQRRRWIWFGAIVFSGFVFINGYLWYLTTRIVPFEVQVPLDRTGYSETFRLCCFHPTDYVLMLTLDHQELDSVALLKDWDRTERQLRAAFDVVLAIELRDRSGNTLISHRGGLDDWKLTNAPAREGTDGGFWKYRFDAHLFEKYQFKVSVVKGNAGAKEFKPTLLFRGVDDGYFWLTRLVYNAMWGVLVSVAAILGLVVHFIRRRHAP